MIRLGKIPNPVIQKAVFLLMSKEQGHWESPQNKELPVASAKNHQEIEIFQYLVKTVCGLKWILSQLRLH